MLSECAPQAQIRHRKSPEHQQGKRDSISHHTCAAGLRAEVRFGDGGINITDTVGDLVSEMCVVKLVHFFVRRRTCSELVVYPADFHNKGSPSSHLQAVFVVKSLSYSRRIRTAVLWQMRETACQKGLLTARLHTCHHLQVATVSSVFCLLGHPTEILRCPDTQRPVEKAVAHGGLVTKPLPKQVATLIPKLHLNRKSHTFQKPVNH